MEGARVRGESIICPHHGARFSLQDGRTLSAVTQNPIAILPCRIIQGFIEIDL
jgi:naphthalene 1,2-dioxygenase system ferredoxin subunit